MSALARRPDPISCRLRMSVFAACATLGLAVGAQAQSTTLVSANTLGGVANGESSQAVISADGQWTAFVSQATDLTSSPTDANWHVFLRDLNSGVVTQVDLLPGGVQPNGISWSPALSGDGRYCAYQSLANDLVPGGPASAPVIYVFDRVTGVTERVSDPMPGSSEQTNGYDPSISADGRYVSFGSGGSTLVPDDTNNDFDVFVHDRDTGTTVRASVASDGTEADGSTSASRLSGDGRYVVFQSPATNLVPGDTNGVDDVFVHDLQTGTTQRVSVSSSGEQGNGDSGSPALSYNGSVVVFQSLADNLVAAPISAKRDIYVRDLIAGTTEMLTVSTSGGAPTGGSENPSISADGRHVLFASFAKNLVTTPTSGSFNLYLHDRVTGTKELLTNGTNASSTLINGNTLSANAGRCVFQTEITDYVPGDTNDADDVFVMQLACLVSFESYGTGLAGSGGVVPSLTGTPGECEGGFAIELGDMLGNAAVTIWMGLGDAALPAKGGTFLIDPGQPMFMIPRVLGGADGVPGSGNLVFAGINATALEGLELFMQVTVLDPGALVGIAFSNGLRITLD